MKKKAFTLIEILVVVTIIGMLMAVTAVSYSQFSKQSRDARRKADLEQIRAALEMYRSNNDAYFDFASNNCSGIGATLHAYLSTVPSDPKSTQSYQCEISLDSYTIGAFLESDSSGSCIAVGCGNSCNYCLGPYGKL
jgi:general secretion pathway protein G